MKYIKIPRIQEKLSVLGLGCGPLHKNGFETGVKMVKEAIKAGINYFDVAPTYPDAKENYGLNERILSEGIRGKEKSLFIATKVLARSYREALKEIKGSIERLGKIDLLQLHAIDTKETINLVFGRKGALPALIEAKKQGWVKYIGITNHYSPIILKECLKQFDFDAVLIPAGVFNSLGNNKFLDAMKPSLKARRLVIGMKIFGHGMLADIAGPALRYALNQPISVILAGSSSIKELNQDLKTFKKPKITAVEEKKLFKIANKILAKDFPWWLQKPSGAFPFE